MTEPCVNQIVDSKYLLQQELGRGGMGVVFRAQRLDGTCCAVKFCLAEDTDSRKRFAREARVMSELDNPHVVQILDSNQEQDPPYIVMPLAANSLEAEIGQNTDEDWAIASILEVCAGVQAIHSAGGTHRDIKPANVLRLSDGRLVVSDLGLIKMEPRESTVLTRTTVFLGTRVYCAPEQLVPRGSREADARTDVYLLGKSLYHLLTGELPGLIDLDRMPRALATVVQKATRENPNDRYQTVGALVDALSSYVSIKQPGAGASRHFDVQLAEAINLARVGQYRQENITALFGALMQFADENSLFIDQFCRLPNEVLELVAQQAPVEMEDVVVAYVACLEADIGNRQFEYAEVVAEKLGCIFVATVSPAIKALALKGILIAAVSRNRYSAMESFAKLLTAVQSDDDALAVAGMIRENAEAYDAVARRVPRGRLATPIKAAHDIITRG